MRKATKLNRRFTELKDKVNGQDLGIYTYEGEEAIVPNGMPTQVRVLGQLFTVRYHSRIYAEPKAPQRLRGIVVYAYRLIVIDPQQSIHMMKETLFHEICHVYLKAWQTKSVCMNNLSPQQVEEVCDMFAEGFYDSLQNNSLSCKE